MLFETDPPVLESPLKKPKVDDVQTTLIGNSSNDDVREQSPENENKSDDDDAMSDDADSIADEHLRQQYRLYRKQLAESDSFDLDFVLRGVPLFSLLVPADFNDKESLQIIEKCAHHAISEYNRLMKHKSQLQLKRIVKAVHNSLLVRNIYITLEAFDTIANATRTYQTIVWVCYVTDVPELSLFRLKGEKEGILFTADPDDLEDNERIRKCAEHAISQYNLEQQETSELVLLRIVKACFHGTIRFRNYHLTLEAKDIKSGRVNTYFSVVYYNYPEEQMYMNSIELKASSNEEDE